MATDTHLGRRVALKLLPEEAVQDLDSRKRFEREARAVAALNHPNVVTVYSIEKAGDTPFITMEWVDGRTLDQLIPPTGMELHEIIRVVVPLARAVAAAHVAGILHRDLKPGNVMVDQGRVVKVLDFGLAKIKDRLSVEGESLSRVRTDPVTSRGVILGTTAYMSPEQAQGLPADHRSDIFSLGVMLYEMATGSRPFKGDTPAAVLSSILRVDPPPVTSVRPGLPEALCSIISRCLEKDPARRPASAGEIADVVDVLDGVPPHRPTDRWVRHIAVWAGVVACLIVVGLLGLNVLPSSGEAAHSAAAAANSPVSLTGAVQVRQLTFTGDSNIPLWSPDGRDIAFSRGARVYVMPAGGGPARPLEGLGASSVFGWNWWPDGSAVLAYSFGDGDKDQSVYRIGLYGEDRQTLVTEARFADASPDGRRLAYADALSPTGAGSAVWILDLETGQRRKLAEPSGPGTSCYKPQWSPAGDRIAYIRWNGYGHELWLYDLENSVDRKVDVGSLLVGGHFEWTADGRSVIIAAGHAGIWSIWKLSVMGDPPVRITHGPHDYQVTASPDERAIAFGRMGDVSRVGILELASGELTYPLDLSVASRHPALSADGTRLYSQVLIDGEWAIWMSPRDGAEPGRLLLRETGGSCLAPSVTSDARLLFLYADMRASLDRFGKVDWAQTLWQVDQDGGRRRRIVAAGDRVSWIAPTPERDGRLLFALNGPEGQEQIQILDPDGTRSQVATDTIDRRLVGFDWGPGDDEVILASVNSDGEVSVVAKDVRSGALTTLLSHEDIREGFGHADMRHGPAMALSPDRQRLAFVASAIESESLAIHLYHLDRESLEQVYVFERPIRSAFLRWSPDGRELVIDLHRRQFDIFLADGLQPLSEPGGR